MQYVSPGDAFSSSLEQSLLVRAQQERQAQMDQLAYEREQRQVRRDAEEAAAAQALMKHNQRKFEVETTEKEKASFEKAAASMLPEDIASPEFAAQAKKFGYGHLVHEAESTPPVRPVPMPAPQIATEGGMSAPMPQAPAGLATEGTPVPMPTSGGMRFRGLPKQREDAAEKAEALKLIAAMPEGPQRQALEFSVRTGKMPPAEMFKSPDSGGQSVARVDPKRNIVQRLVDGQWTDVTGDVPKGTHFLQQPTPADPNIMRLREEAAADRDVRDRDRAYNRADTELNKLSVPFEGQLKNLENAEEVLHERSPSGDAHVAPMILKALVAGEASGFRMTKAEIDQVQNARTKWQSIDAALRKYSLNPKDALFFDDAQRKDFLDLIGTVKKVTLGHLDDINVTRGDINKAKSSSDIQNHMTDMHTRKVTKAKEKDAAKRSPEDVWKQYTGGKQ